MKIKNIYDGTLGIILIFLPTIFSNLITVFFPIVNTVIPSIMWISLVFPCGYAAGKLFHNIYKRNNEEI